MAYALRGDAVEKAAGEFDVAIRLGLPDDDEMQAHSFLGERYLEMARASCESFEEYIASPHIAPAMEHFEKALLTDREGGYGYFSEPLNRCRLRALDTMYNLVADDITEGQGEAATIRYLQQKIGLSAYLPSCPLLHALLKLASLYMLQGQRESARVCLRNLLAAAPVDESGEEQDVREKAREGLRCIS
jgi:tetratricopeptide (TPR) repeat protein